MIQSALARPLGTDCETDICFDRKVTGLLHSRQKSSADRFSHHRVRMFIVHEQQRTILYQDHPRGRINWRAHMTD